MRNTWHYVPVVLALCTAAAHAQFDRLKGATVSVGATSNFDRTLTSNPTTGVYDISTPTGGVLSETVSNQQQFTTNAVGVLGQVSLHPVAWAGVEVNYGFTRFSERYAFNYSSAPGTQQLLSVPVTMHETTAAYEFHPPHIKFQPFVNVGGGAVDFLPTMNNNQWRGAGLLEAGFDIPSGFRHLAFRVQGRALIYRAPNFNLSEISTRSWQVTAQPAVSAVFRF